MACNARAMCKGMAKCAGGNTKEMINPPDKRNDLIPTKKFKKVMGEYGRGELKSSSGQKVTNPKQAEAIAASESHQSYKKKQMDRKNADRYGRGKK